MKAMEKYIIQAIKPEKEHITLFLFATTLRSFCLYWRPWW